MKGELKLNEKQIENYLVRAVKSKGGMAMKFVSPGMSGVPDRLILLPGGKMCFAETKRPGGKPRKLQCAVHKLLNRLGFRVFIIDSKEGAENMLRLVGE
jgi:hypothetical protein